MEELEDGLEELASGEGAPVPDTAEDELGLENGTSDPDLCDNKDNIDASCINSSNEDDVVPLDSSASQAGWNTFTLNNGPFFPHTSHLSGLESEGLGLELRLEAS